MRRINWIVPDSATALLWLVIFPLQCGTAEVASAAAHDDRTLHASCRHCGMNRTKFAHSRMLITYTDGAVTPACSIHCVALDLALKLSQPFRELHVGDYASRELINAEKAHWVLGGDRPGVMTRRAKWAFATEKAARDFIRQHGGELTDFAGALKAAYQDMYDFVTFRRKQAS